MRQVPLEAVDKSQLVGTFEKTYAILRGRCTPTIYPIYCPELSSCHVDEKKAFSSGPRSAYFMQRKPMELIIFPCCCRDADPLLIERCTGLAN